ncbi:MAG: hypothetical protein ACXWKW_05335 [Asticcacaulis sp.]
MDNHSPAPDPATAPAEPGSPSASPYVWLDADPAVSVPSPGKAGLHQANAETPRAALIRRTVAAGVAGAGLAAVAVAARTLLGGAKTAGGADQT